MTDSESTTHDLDDDGTRALVREAYGRVARREEDSCCGPRASQTVSGCCTTSTATHADAIGYSQQEQAAAPEGANLGLGCGNPTALAELSEGEVVIDLGAGAGFDAFIAAEHVGPSGRVIGVDMTPDMLARSRALAVEHGVAGYVEFREGLVEDLPVVDASADVVISNCVINLVPDKARAFREAYRVLKPGGRLAVSDILLSAPLDEELKGMAELYVGCVAGALLVDDYFAAIAAAGFVDVEYDRVSAGPSFSTADDPLVKQAAAIVGEERLHGEVGKIWSYKIRASKP